MNSLGIIFALRICNEDVDIKLVIKVQAPQHGNDSCLTNGRKHVCAIFVALQWYFLKLPVEASRAQPHRHLTQHETTNHAIYARQDVQAQARHLQKASSQPTSTEIRGPHLAWNVIIPNT